MGLECFKMLQISKVLHLFMFLFVFIYLLENNLMNLQQWWNEENKELLRFSTKIKMGSPI